MTTLKKRERKITILSLSKFPTDGDFRTENGDSDSRRVSVVLPSNFDFDVNREDDEENEKKLLRKCIKKQGKELVWMLAGFCVYIVFGMFVFFYIEECSGASKPNDTSLLRADVTVTGGYDNLTASCIDVLNLFQNESLLNTTESNMTAVFQNKTLKDCEIEMAENLVPLIIRNATVPFCHIDEYTLLKYAEFTIFTCLTIGYGNTTPETIIGRSILIVYAIFGMPIALTMYSVAGKLVVQLITIALQIFQKRVLKKTSNKVKHIQLKVLGISVGLFILIIFAGSAVTSQRFMENLSFSSSVYFWFISLSTIGYGDITFERDQHLKYPHMMMVSVFTLLFGIGILAAIIAAVSLALEKRNLQMSTLIIDEQFLDDDEGFSDKEEKDSGNLSNEYINESQQEQKPANAKEKVNKRSSFDLDREKDENNLITVVSTNHNPKVHYHHEMEELVVESSFNTNSNFKPSKTLKENSLNILKRKSEHSENTTNKSMINE